MAKNVISIVNERGQNSASVIRMFTKRVMGSGILKKARSRRFFSRNVSHLTKKTSTLTRIDRREKVEKLLKLGKPLKSIKKGGKRK